MHSKLKWLEKRIQMFWAAMFSCVEIPLAGEKADKGKNKDRPAWTPSVLFVVASDYQSLQITEHVF